MKKWSKSFLTGLTAAITLFACLPETAFRSARAFETEKIPEGARIGETLYENVAGGAISAWTTEGIKIGWEYESATAQVEVSGGQGVHVKALDAAKAVALPVAAETDYVYSATVLASSDGGEFGLLMDLKNEVTQSDGATYYGVRIGDESDYGIYTYVRANDEYYEQTYANPVRTFGECVSRGDVCTLTVYNLLGRRYFYVNGEFVTSSETQFFEEDGRDTFGFYVNCADVTITSVSVKTLVGVTDAFTLEVPEVRYADEDGYTFGKGSFGLRYRATVDKMSDVYENAGGKDSFDATDTDIGFGMLLLPTEYLKGNEALTKETPMVLDVPMEKILSQTNSILRFTVSLLDIPEEQFEQDLTARIYMKVRKGDEWEYTYSREKSHDLINAGNLYYEGVENAKVRARLDSLFGGYDSYCGKNAQRVKFSLFADFHYRENVYMSSIADMNAIIEKAHTNDADFVLHLGDFCNNYTGSPEIVNAYLNNTYDMPVYGIYGNHELEGARDTMAFVTPRLTNRADEVHWGTTNGKIGDGSIGYYYFDVNGIRIICMDTNYGWHKENQEWVHREKLKFQDTYGDGAVVNENAFGIQQRLWLKKVLYDAAERDMSCIVLSHHATSGMRSQHPADAEEVRQIFKLANEKRAGTVLMVMNGHLHTDSILFRDDILYFDVNTVRNGTYWNYNSEIGETGYDYGDMTFDKISYDDDGNETGTSSMLVNKLTGSDETWFFADPLSAIVSVSSSGYIRIEGMQTTWFAGEEPKYGADDGTYVHPWISSGVFDVPVN